MKYKAQILLQLGRNTEACRLIKRYFDNSQHKNLQASPIPSALVMQLRKTFYIKVDNQ